MSATPSTVSGHYILEPSSANNAALDNGTNGTISASTTGTVANTTAAVNELLLVGVAIASGSVTVSGIADTRTLTWHKLSAITGAGAIRGEIWWAWEPTAQTHTITVTLSSSGTAELICGSFSGVQSGVALGTAGASLPFDPAVITASYLSGTAQTTAGTNANPADMLIGFCGSLSNPSFTVGASYTTVSSAANGTTVSAGMEYLNVTTSASQTFNYTLGSGHPAVMMGVALMSSGNNVQLISAPTSQEFILKNIYASGAVAIVKWDGNIPALVGIAQSLANLSYQVTNLAGSAPDLATVVLINVSASIPVEVGYDGIRSI